MATHVWKDPWGTVVSLLTLHQFTFSTRHLHIKGNECSAKRISHWAHHRLERISERLFSLQMSKVFALVFRDDTEDMSPREKEKVEQVLIVNTQTEVHNRSKEALGSQHCFRGALWNQQTWNNEAKASESTARSGFLQQTCPHKEKLQKDQTLK